LLGGTSKVGGGNEAEKAGKLFKQINMLMGSFWGQGHLLLVACQQGQRAAWSRPIQR